MYEHSIKVYSLYKQAAQIVKQIKEGSTVNVKELVNRKQRRRRAKALQALVVETLQRHSQIDFLLKRSKLLATETHLDPWLMRVLITELLWGSKTLKGDSKPVKAILAYQQVFKAHVSDLRDQFKKVPVKVSKPRFVRVNTLLMTVNEAVEGFVQEGWSLVRHTNANYEEFIYKVSNLGPDEFMVDMNIKELLVFPPGVQFCEHGAYQNGSIILQDKASCFPVQLLNPKPGSVVLDMCAAPGIKTSHIAALMNNDGCIYAIDRTAERFTELNKFLEKSGVTCAKTFNKDALTISKDDCPNVDCILVDPSCSGSGMVNRLELGLYESKKADRLANLAGFQIKLLKHALRKFPTAKRVVYSTCSINPEENEHVVREVLYSNSNYRLMSATDLLNVPWPRFSSLQYGDVGKNCLTMGPENDCTNGFFVAVFERLEGGMQNPLFTPYFRDNFNRKNSNRYENEVENGTRLRKNREESKEQQNSYEIRENGVGTYANEVESTVMKRTEDKSIVDTSCKRRKSVYENEAETNLCEVKEVFSKKNQRRSEKINKFSPENYENEEIKTHEVCSKKKRKKLENSKEKQMDASPETQDNNECESKTNTCNVKEVCLKKKKKKRDKSKDKESHECQENQEKNVDMLDIDTSTKKHKKNKRHDDATQAQNVVDLEPVEKVHKKKKLSKNEDTPNEQDNISVQFIKKKKNKCKSKENDLDENPKYPIPDSRENIDIFDAGSDLSKLKKKKTKRKESNEDIQIEMKTKKKKKSKHQDEQIENDFGDIFGKKEKKLIDEDVRVANDAIGAKKKKKSKNCEQVQVENDTIGNDLGSKHKVNFFDAGKSKNENCEVLAEDFTPQVNGTKLLNIRDFIGQSKDNFIKDILTKRF